MRIVTSALLCIGICFAFNAAGQDAQPDTSKYLEVINALIGKFGAPASVDSVSAIFTDYTWKSNDGEIGRKFKNEVDKFLNLLPSKSDSNFDLETAAIEDTDIWETPRILVKLTSTFGSALPETTVVVRVNVK